jgi:hypothetical protein
VTRSVGELALRDGDAAGAIAVATAGLASAGSARSRARLLNLVGLASAERGSMSEAIEALRDELAAEEEAGLELMRCTTRSNLAEALLREGHALEAARHQAAVLDEARANQDVTLIAFSVLVAAQVSLDDGHVYEAQVLRTAGQQLLDDAGVALLSVDLDALSALDTAIVSDLGAEPHRLATLEARGLDADAAADRASDVLLATAELGALR